MNEKLWTKEYLYSVFILFLCHMGPYLLLSVISLFAKQLTGSDAYAGMMASVFALSGLAARFLSAWLLERFGSKKVMIVSMIIMAAASFAYVFCTNYWDAFILRGIQGLGYCTAVTSMSTYIVRIIAPSRRLEGIGYSSLTGSAAGVIGPVAAFALIGQNMDHFKTLFIVLFAVAMSAVLGLFFIKENGPVKVEKQAKVKDSAIRWGILVIPLLIQILVSFAMSPLSSQLSLYAVELGFGGVGAYFTISAIGLVLSRFTVSFIVRKLGNGKAILLFGLLIGLSLFALSRINSMWQLLCLGLVIGYGQGALTPLINTILVNSLPDSKSGVANALFFACGDLGFILGPTLWGALAGVSSYAFVFFMTAVVVTFSALLSLFTLRKERSAEKA